MTEDELRVANALYKVYFEATRIITAQDWTAFMAMRTQLQAALTQFETLATAREKQRKGNDAHAEATQDGDAHSGADRAD